LQGRDESGEVEGGERGLKIGGDELDHGIDEQSKLDSLLLNDDEARLATRRERGQIEGESEIDDRQHDTALTDDANDQRRGAGHGGGLAPAQQLAYGGAGKGDLNQQQLTAALRG
jgi:hypothetical protein